MTVCVGLHAESFRAGCAAIVSHDFQNAFTESAFAIACGSAIKNEQAFIPGITAHAVSQSFLEEPSLLRISAGDLIDEGQKAVTLSVGIIIRRGDFCEPIFRIMRSEGHSVQVQSAITTVKHIRVAVKFLDADGMNTLGIFEDDFTGASGLPFGAILEILLSLALVLDRQCIDHKIICKILAHLHG